MRFIAVVAIWVVIVGGLAFYIHKRDSRIITSAEARISQIITEESFALEITPTFGIESDPFALVGETDSLAALTVRLNGRDLNYADKALERGESIKIEDIQGFITGNNELFFDASPPLAESHLSHALRVKLYRSGHAVLDQTIWSEAGSKVSGSIPYQVADAKEKDHDDH